MKSLSVLCAAILLVGCASQSIEPSYYLLRSNQDTPSGKLSPSRDFSLGKVEIAAYIDQPGLVMETNDTQIRPASQHLWAEPVYEGVRNYLATEIAQASGYELLPSKLNRDATAVNIRIDQLHGTIDGNAHIVAYWWLVHGDEVVAMNRFADSRALPESGYGALVAAEKTLLTELARQIAASLAASPT